MAIPQDVYIPAGSIYVRREDCDLSIDQWSSSGFHSWTPLELSSQPDGRDQTPQDGRPDSPAPLSPNIQRALLGISKLNSLSGLLESQWIKAETSITNEESLILRIYILPDDVLRSVVDRSSLSLMKSRHELIRSLDYSKDAWEGHLELQDMELRKQASTPSFMNGEQERETSLLELFNSIPSPNPDPDSVSEPTDRDAMFDLLGSTVQGLKTELYFYQRRSAASMLQKEVNPSQVLDPRLVSVQDQNQLTWYLDPVSGNVLREARYYDGVSGGILAEEMGSGKTIICLALILATRNLPCQSPGLYGIPEPSSRPRVGSLMDMAAASVTRHSVPWKPYMRPEGDEDSYMFLHCSEAIQRNPGYYFIPPPVPLRQLRHVRDVVRPHQKVLLSSATVIVVPNNLLAQWNQEIRKHTETLRVLVIIRQDEIPAASMLLEFDIILFSESRFEAIVLYDGGVEDTPLSQVHFKRCIVDEGHKLGNSRVRTKSNVLIGLESLHVTARWIVTGTPAQGLFGLDITKGTKVSAKKKKNSEKGGDAHSEQELMSQKATELEKKDLERIGAIASLYLKVRPWANTSADMEDSRADWTVYLMLRKHHPKGQGRWDCLRSTLSSLILRHQLAEVRDLLPPVTEQIVFLDGSYQDRLSLNAFSMMIIFNSVQSQRTDQDYFFHPKQRRALLQIVSNMRQSSFFGGSFFSPKEILKAVETAENFLKEGKVTTSTEDEALLKQAIEFGHVVATNSLRKQTNEFHEMPVLVKDFPGAAGETWSLDGVAGSTACTSTSLLLSLQKLVYNTRGQPETLNALLNGGLISEGRTQREKILAANRTDEPEGSRNSSRATLAGNTILSGDTAKKSRSHGVNGLKTKKIVSEDFFSGPLDLTQITATVSAKMSYLIDGLVQHSKNEKIIVFYENENIAWYLASMLDVVQLQYLIYAKSLTAQRRAQYVNTFHNNDAFRILLMDLTQAAFGLDMRGASRVYFLSPVLNPQVEAQAIGRVRRISQQKPVSVETLVLRGSIDEVLLERKQHMTPAEHRQAKSVLDIRPVYDYIKKASMVPLARSSSALSSSPEIGKTTEIQTEAESQMAPLRVPLPVFGRGFGRGFHPNEGIVLDEQATAHRIKNGDGASDHVQEVTSRDHTPGQHNEKRAWNGNGNVNGGGVAINRMEAAVRNDGPSASNSDEAAPLPKRIKFAV